MKSRLAVIIFGVIELAIGVMLLANPVTFTTWIVISLGIIIALVGIFNVVKYFRTPAPEASLERSLALGLALVLVGTFLALKSEWIIALFPILAMIYGVGTLLSGITKIQWTADMIRLKTGHWVWMAISAVLTIVCSIIILLNPFTSSVALWIFIGVTIIVEAIIDIISAIFKKDLS